MFVNEVLVLFVSSVLPSRWFVSVHTFFVRLRQARARFAASTERQRAGSEKETSPPRQRGGGKVASKASPEVSIRRIFF